MQQEAFHSQSSTLHREINPGTGHPSLQQGNHIIHLMACRAQSDNHCSNREVYCIRVGGSCRCLRVRQSD